MQTVSRFFAKQSAGYALCLSQFIARSAALRPKPKTPACWEQLRASLFTHKLLHPHQSKMRIAAYVHM
jgi:hypothetical protein